MQALKMIVAKRCDVSVRFAPLKKESHNCKHAVMAFVTRRSKKLTSPLRFFLFTVTISDIVGHGGVAIELDRLASGSGTNLLPVVLPVSAQHKR